MSMTANTLSQQWQTTYVDTFELLTCGECGIPFYVPYGFYRGRREDRRTWYCPNGHPRAFKESDADRLKRELRDERDRTRFLRDDIERQRAHRQHAERRVTAMKGVVTKTKKRVAAGKCVRCSEEFPDLKDHMAECHPDYVAADDS